MKKITVVFSVLVIGLLLNGCSANVSSERKESANSQIKNQKIISENVSREGNKFIVNGNNNGIVTGSYIITTGTLRSEVVLDTGYVNILRNIYQYGDISLLKSFSCKDYPNNYQSCLNLKNKYLKKIKEKAKEIQATLSNLESNFDISKCKILARLLIKKGIITGINIYDKYVKQCEVSYIVSNNKSCDLLKDPQLRSTCKLAKKYVDLGKKIKFYENTYGGFDLTGLINSLK